MTKVFLCTNYTVSLFGFSLIFLPTEPEANIDGLAGVKLLQDLELGNGFLTRAAGHIELYQTK